MTNERLAKARDLVSRSEYGEVDGKKVIVATVYSSRSLGVEERVERVRETEGQVRGGSRRIPPIVIEEKKE
jgi:hypothetical protein